MVSPDAGCGTTMDDQVQPRSWAARLRGVLARAGQAPGPGDADRDHAEVIAGARRAGGQLAGVAPGAGCPLPRAGRSSSVRPVQGGQRLLRRLLQAGGGHLLPALGVDRGDHGTITATGSRITHDVSHSASASVS